MAFPLAVVKEVLRVAKNYAPKDFIIGYRISPEEIHGSEVGYTYKESTALVKEIVKNGLDYIYLSLWDGYASSPKGVNKSYAELFKEVMDDDTKLIIVGGVFDEKSAKDAVQNYTDIIAVGRGTLIEPNFAGLIEDGKGDKIHSQITPEMMDYVCWTNGLLEAFSRDDSLRLPPLPNAKSIRHLHTGILIKNDRTYRTKCAKCRRSH